MNSGRKQGHQTGPKDPRDTFELSDDEAIVPLTPQQAQELRSRLQWVSPWSVVGVQAAVGSLCVLVAGLWSASPEVAKSALWGMMAVLVPAALMAKVMGLPPADHAAAAMKRLARWQGVKILLTVAILVAAVRWTDHLSWPAMLLTLVLCLKVYGLALLWMHRRP